MGEGKGRGSRGVWRRNGEGLRRQSWRWERKCVGQGKLGKGVNGGVRKLGGYWKKEGLFFNMEEGKE